MPQRAFSRDQAYLLPPSPNDWLPRDHPVRLVAAVVDALTEAEWAALGVAPADETGAPRYAPEVLLSVWLAGFMQGIRTTRKLEYACREQLSFLWLTAGQTPDHNTLARFYTAHREKMHVVLHRSVAIAVKSGAVDLAVQAVDGSKVLANAARERRVTAETLEALRAQTDAAIADLESQLVGDDDPPPPTLPAELANRERLRARVDSAKAELDRDDAPKSVNLTDPEARMMLTRQGRRFSYNAQAVVAAVKTATYSGRMILAADVSTAVRDVGLLAPMIRQARVRDSPTPITLADAGYHSGATLAACAAIAAPIVMPESNRHARMTDPYHKSRFVYDQQTDTFTCPQGKVLQRQGRGTRRDQQTIYRAQPADCRACPAFGVCTPSSTNGRTVCVGPDEERLVQHRDWMETDQARALSARRRGLIEGVFGTIKDRCQASRFQLRGFSNVKAEWTMLVIGYNLNTLARLWATTTQPARNTRLSAHGSASAMVAA